ncbi:MAG: phosphate ABC transporter permease PstA [Calditrichia bacterium]
MSLKVFSTFSAFVGIFFLGWILIIIIHKGASAINWDFFTKLPPPPGGSGGGLGNAILGTFYMTLLAAFIGVPLGILAGVYLSEYGRDTRFGALVRFTVNVMMGIPSIISGLFIYTLVVVSMGHFSGYAGGLALALLILPIVARTAEDMLSLVPNSLRESALALGVPRWRVTMGIIFRAARTGMITGVLLAVARISGETAPLLFTSLNSPYWPTSLNQPVGNLTVTIFNYAMSPYANWQSMAWGASLLITAAVLSLTILARLLLGGEK